LPDQTDNYAILHKMCTKVILFVQTIFLASFADAYLQCIICLQLVTQFSKKLLYVLQTHD